MEQRRGAGALAWSVALAVLLPGAALAQGYGYSQRVSLPQGTVLKAELNDRLSSTSNRPGDRFTGNIVSDGSGLPSGTQVIGQVTDVRPADDSHPGVVDVDFRTLRLPNGRTYPIDGQLISLDSDSVRQSSSGRLEARGSSSRNKYQFLGYGAGAGALISALTGGGLLKGALLGALAGFAYQQLNKDKRDHGHYSEVNLKPGTEFGVALQNGATISLAENAYGNSYGSRDRNGSGYNSPNGGAYNGRYPRSDERTAGSLQQYRGSSVRVLVDGRDVPFTQGQPFMSHGHVMVPLEPVMAAAGLRYTYDPTYREVAIFGNHATRFSIGDNFATIDGDRTRLDEPIQRIDGTIYVPSNLLEQAANFRGDWNPDTRELRLRTGSRSSDFPP